MNQFGLFTEEEVAKRFTGKLVRNEFGLLGSEQEDEEPEDDDEDEEEHPLLKVALTTKDWDDEGYVTPVKDQG